MAGFSTVLQGMIRGRIGAPAASGTRQAPPSVGNRPAARNGSGAGGRERDLSAHKVWQMLKWYTSKQFRAQRRVLITALADMACLSRQTIYVVIRTGRMSERTRLLLYRAISEIEKHGIEHCRHGQYWDEYRQPSPSLAIPRRASDWNDSPAAIIEKINDYGRRPKTVPVDLGVITINVCTGW